MKKVLILIEALVCALLLASCATLPKTIKDGDTLVIGQVKCSLAGYKKTNGVNMNGMYTSGLEVKVIDENTNREYEVRTDKDGYFYIKNLPVHHRCAISYVEVKNIKNDGNGYRVWVTVQPEQRSAFIPYDGTVVNIGQTEFYFDGSRNYCHWETLDHSSVSDHFKQLDESSEWLKADIYEQ